VFWKPKNIKLATPQTSIQSYRVVLDLQLLKFDSRKVIKFAERRGGTCRRSSENMKTELCLITYSIYLYSILHMPRMVISLDKLL
jgi:hypothetical protein